MQHIPFVRCPSTKPGLKKTPFIAHAYTTNNTGLEMLFILQTLTPFEAQRSESTAT